MEIYFTTMFEDIRHERSGNSLPSLPDPDMLKQNKLRDTEIIFLESAS